MVENQIIQTQGPDRRRKQPNEPLQFYHDVIGIMERAKREGIPVEDLTLRETGDERKVILYVIKKVGDIIIK